MKPTRLIWLGVVALALSSRVLAQDLPEGGIDASTASLDAGPDDAPLPDASVDDDASAPGAEPPAAEPPATEPPAAMLAPLPAVEPDPEIAPIVVGRNVVSSPAPLEPEDRPRAVLGTVVGLLALLALAYLGGHPRVQALEQRLGISQVITAGFPFVVLGLLSRRVGLLSDDLLADLSPLLRVGLGAIGFVAGFRFGAQFRAAPGTAIARVAAWATAVPFALVALVCGAALLSFGDELGPDALRDPVFLRDAIILGTAGAMTARTSTGLFRTDDAERLLARVLRFEELAGVIGLAVVAAYFRSLAEASWQLPGTAWLLLTIGLGATIGLIAYAVLARPYAAPDFVVLTLGTIAFGAGIAGYLRLSPVVVAFIGGSVLTTLPSAYRDRVHGAIRRVERPIYLLSLIVIGALFQVDDWRGWALVPLFTAARFAGKWLGARLAARFAGIDLTSDEQQVLAVSPMGPLAIAIVVNAQLLYPGGSISHIVVAVIGGAIVTEVVVQLKSRRTPSGGDGPPPLASIALSSPPERMP